MTMKEIGQRMDAKELMEWMAYFMILDEKEVTRLNQEIINDNDAAYHDSQLRSFFKSLTKKKSHNDTNK